jgi:hypothetical protein
MQLIIPHHHKILKLLHNHQVVKKQLMRENKKL